MSFPLGSHIEQKIFHFHSLISHLRTICYDSASLKCVYFHLSSMPALSIVFDDPLLSSLCALWEKTDRDGC